MARIKNDFQMKVNWGFMRNMEMIDPSNSSSCAEFEPKQYLETQV